MRSKTNYETMGMAALLPGMQYMLERMQAAVDDLREALTDAQANGLPPVKLKRGTGRPKGRSGKRPGGGGWAALSPAERSAEMKRRLALTASLKRRRKQGAAASSYWAGLTDAQKQAIIAKRVASLKKTQAAKKKANA